MAIRLAIVRVPEDDTSTVDVLIDVPLKDNLLKELENHFLWKKSAKKKVARAFEAAEESIKQSTINLP